jgi:hypothetical protein
MTTTIDNNSTAPTRAVGTDNDSRRRHELYPEATVNMLGMARYPFLDPSVIPRLHAFLIAHNYKAYISMVPKPYRVVALRQVMDCLTDVEFWSALGDVWTSTEIPGKYGPWIELFNFPRPGRSALMTAEDHVSFSALPDIVRLYRGQIPTKKRGMSWTTDLSIARWFAKRNNDRDNTAAVFTAEVPKARFLAYFTDRNESEAVIDPRRISGVLHTVLPVEETAQLRDNRLEAA